jgi:RNA polymerase sigma-70 factor (ECF subfamily)
MKQAESRLPFADRLRAGEAAAFEECYTAHAKELFSFLLKYCSDRTHIEDMVQETFCRLWAGRAQLKPALCVRNYLFTIARNLWNDHLRRQMAGQPLSYECLHAAGIEVHDRREDHPDRLAQAEIVRFVQSQVDRLAEKERAALVLRKVNGLSYDEIARVIGESERNVKRRVRKAVDLIAAELEAAGYQGRGGILVWILA